MELYLIRHGQTDWNKEERLQGTVDIELNENGRSSAMAAGEKLKDVIFDKVYSSPLSRAYTTARLICRDKNPQIIIDERLQEISFGALEGKTYAEITTADSPFRYFFSPDEVDKYVPPEGGESLEHLCQRTKEFVQQVIEPQAATEKRILVVAHGALLAGMMCYLDNHGISNFWGDGLRKNCQATIYEYNSASGKWTRK